MQKWTGTATSLKQTWNKLNKKLKKKYNQQGCHGNDKGTRLPQKRKSLAYTPKAEIEGVVNQETNSGEAQFFLLYKCSSFQDNDYSVCSKTFWKN